MKTSPIIIGLHYCAIAGNGLFMVWVTYNAIDESFSGTIYEKISYLALMGLLLTNCLLLIRSLRPATAKTY